MKNMIFVFFVLIALFISPLYSQHKVIKIWPGLAPGTEGRENNEKITNGSVTNVYQPDLTIFLPEKIKNSIIYDPQDNPREKEVRERLSRLWKGKYKY